MATKVGDADEVGKSFIDTNIFVYAFSNSDPQRQPRAARVVTELIDSDRAVISVQVLKELFVVVTQRIRTPIEVRKAVQIVEDLMTLHVVDDTLPLFRKALTIHRSRSISMWDATLVAAAISAGCTRLLSADLNHGERIDGVTIVDPFR